MSSLGKDFLNSSIRRFKYYKELGDKTFEQLNDWDFHYQPNDESNSIAIIIQHMAGNMLAAEHQEQHGKAEDKMQANPQPPERQRDADIGREDQPLGGQYQQRNRKGRVEIGLYRMHHRLQRGRAKNQPARQPG